MNLIKKSTVFDQDIKSENYESYKIYFEKNIKFDKKVKFDKTINVEENVKFQLYPISYVGLEDELMCLSSSRNLLESLMSADTSPQNFH